MSVIAFVQSKNNDGILIAKDATLVSKDEKAKLKLDIEEIFLRYKNVKTRPFLSTYKNKYVFLGKHKIIDTVGRTRDFLIYWDKNVDKELINKTANLIEISDEFDVNNLPKQKNINFKFIIVISIIIIIILLIKL